MWLQLIEFLSEQFAENSCTSICFSNRCYREMLSYLSPYLDNTAHFLVVTDELMKFLVETNSRCFDNEKLSKTTSPFSMLQDNYREIEVCGWTWSVELQPWTQ